MGSTKQLIFLYGKREENTARLSPSLKNNHFSVQDFFDLETLESRLSEQPFALIFTAGSYGAIDDLKKLKQRLNSNFDSLPLIIIVNEEDNIEARIAAANAGADFFFSFNVKSF